MLYNIIHLTAEERLVFSVLCFVLLFTVLLNNNDVKAITAVLVESEISQQNTNVFN